MKIISKYIYIFYVCLAFSIYSLNVHAWTCGQSRGLPRDMYDAYCDRQYQGNAVRLICSINFDQRTSAKVKYDAGIYFKNSEGKKFRADGEWTGNGSYYVRFENVNLKSNDAQFYVQFIVQEKRRDGRVYYQSKWIPCK